MFFSNWLRTDPAQGVTRNRVRARKSHGFRPFLERLEDRLTPSAGDLDLTFGTGGKVTTDIGDFAAALAIAVQPDEKIVVAGQSSNSQNATGVDFAVVRYNPDGTLDPSFGDGGKTTIDFSGTLDSCSSAAIDASGRIILAGTSYQGASGYDFAVARLMADGSLDTSFGVAGKVTIDLGSSYEFGKGLALDASGRIVVAGFSYQDATGYDFAVARLTSSGSLDVTFGEAGRTTIDFGSSDDVGLGLALDASGRIVVAGQSYQDATGTHDFAVARLTDSGNLDVTFGEAGRTTIDFGSDDSGSGVALEAGGRIVVAGWSYQAATGTDFAVARLTSSGSLDGTFGEAGRTTIDFGSSDDFGTGMALDAGGRIVVAGYSNQYATGYDFAVARLTNSGNLDVTFGEAGRTTIDFGSEYEIASAVALDASGRIVVAGYTDRNATGVYDFAVARLQDVLTPQKLIDLADNYIDQLVADGRLNQGQADSLRTKVRQIGNSIQAENWNRFSGLIGAFINQVKAWDGTILTQEEAEFLISLAELLLDAAP